MNTLQLIAALLALCGVYRVDKLLRVSALVVSEAVCPPGRFASNSATTLGPVCVQCAPGHYCRASEQFPCPAGRYGDAEGLSTPGCSGPCREGFWCGEGATSPRQNACGSAEDGVYCPEGVRMGPIPIEPGTYTDPDRTHDGALPCSPGYYCEKGHQIECPAGSWGNTTRLSHSSCDGPCEPGFWCEAKSTSPRQHPCGAVDRICPRGSADNSAMVHEGYYSLPENGLETERSSEARCGPGYWCKGGRRYRCAPGTYGDGYGHTSPTCTAPCPAGFYCPSGTIIPKACGGTDLYCPLGSPSPKNVSEGYFSYREDSGVPRLEAVREAWTPGSASREVEVDGVDGNPALKSSWHNLSGTEDGSARLTFRAGRFLVIQEPDATQDKRSHQKKCSPGYYCKDGIRHLCPAGRYGSEEGETRPLCSGESHAGYFAPPGSTSPKEYACGAPNLFCPAGSSTPLPVSPGYYTFADQVVLRNTSTECSAESDWRWSWRDTMKQGNPDGSGSSWTGGPLHPSGTACKVYMHRALYFPLHNDGYPCTGAHCHELVRTHQVICPRGAYCRNGRRYEMPPGRYGYTTGATDAYDDGPTGGTGECRAGYFCPPGSTSATERKCGSPNVYCPAGSGDPTPTSEGYYTTIGKMQKSELELVERRAWWNLPEFVVDPRDPLPYSDDFGEPPSGKNEDEMIKFEQRICEEGYFCVNGRREACPRGRYGDKKGLTTKECSGNCYPGYVCPAGSFSPKQVPCGTGRENPSAFYCPGYGALGSWKPLQVSVGYYTVGGDNKYNNTRSAQKICPLGHFCVGGKMYRCPGGTYGNTTGLSTPECSGKCPAGYFCRPATVEAFNSGPNPVALLARDILFKDMKNAGILESKFAVTGGEPFDNASHLAPLECGSLFGVRGPCYPAPDGSSTFDLATGERRCELKVTWGEDLEILYHFGNGWDTIVHHETEDLSPNQPLHYHYHTQFHTDSRVRWTGESAAVFCPEGSSKPTSVGPGYYTIGGNETTNRTRASQKLVERGYFAESGRKLRCPPGFYGDQQGLSTQRCSGFCPAGHYCPWATADPIPCPDGTYTSGGAFYCMKCPRPPGTETPSTCKTGRSCCFK